MPEFIFTGTLKLSGVTFFVDAPDVKQAIQRAKAGEYSSYEIDAAETADCKLDPDTCALNE